MRARLTATRIPRATCPRFALGNTALRQRSLEKVTCAGESDLRWRKSLALEKVTCAGESHLRWRKSLALEKVTCAGESHASHLAISRKIGKSPLSDPLGPGACAFL